jgi:hypothetical protein
MRNNIYIKGKRIKYIWAKELNTLYFRTKRVVYPTITINGSSMILCPILVSLLAHEPSCLPACLPACLPP